MAFAVEWRHRDGSDALVVVDPTSRAVSDVATPDEVSLKAYLKVASSLTDWRKAVRWDALPRGEDADPDRWGELVLSRAESGEVTYIEPELFWEAVHRWFRSKGTDYTS